MENLIEILNKESESYDGLLETSRKKTSVIVAGDLEALSQLTEEEQIKTDKIANLEKKRNEVMLDMANVLNKDVNTLKLTQLLDVLASRPAEQKALASAIDRVKASATALMQVNKQNSELLKNSIEMVEFELGLLQAMKGAPETANYSRGAYNTGDTMGVARKGFDAKQ
ncbi:MAG: flagellar protein FlgN [Lachnospiraceae bacterium]|nr:flagellar protein FlgN [Lachnospiraceae bacterium]